MSHAVPLYNIGEAFEDEQTQYLGMAKPAPHPELGDINLIRTPINLTRFPAPDRFDRAAPDPGQDNTEVLSEFGYDEATIQKLAADGAI